MPLHDTWIECALRITGHFEDSSDPLAAVSGDFDNQGISLGVLQWNIGSGSLQPIIKSVGRDTVLAGPVQADWLLGAFLFLRRELLDELGGFDEGFRLYGEDIDLAYRAAKAGWERWYVPEAKAVHVHAAETDRRFLTRRTLWHWRGIARFVRKHPELLKASGRGPNAAP